MKNKILFLAFLTQGLFADSNMLSQIDTQTTSFISELIKVMGNIGSAVAVISLMFVIFALMNDNENVRRHMNKAIVTMVAGAILKILAVVTNFSNLF